MTYLDNNIKNEQDAIEKIVCEPISRLRTYPMSQDDTKFFVSLTFFKEGSKELADLFEVIKKKSPVSYGILTQRIFKNYNFSVDDRIVIFLSGILGTPGDVVLYGTYLAYYAKKNNRKKITWEDFAMKIFPFGFPSTDDLQKIWDSQKIHRDENDRGSDNLLDYISAGQSLIQN